VDRLFAVVRVASIAGAVVAVVMLLNAPATPPDQAVHRAFAAFKRAVLAGDGPAAAALVSTDTLDWYGKTQDLALHASKDEVQNLGPLEKIQVLAFRQRVPLDELRAMSPPQLVAYSVAHGWMGKKAMERSELGTVTVSDDTAVATLLVDGKDSGQKYHFIRESGRWLFDQLPTLQSSDDTLKAAAAKRGMPIDVLVRTLLESASGQKLTDEIWQPPLPRATPAV
jgi:hypothetical protein